MESVVGFNWSIFLYLRLNDDSLTTVMADSSGNLGKSSHHLSEVDLEH